MHLMFILVFDSLWRNLYAIGHIFIAKNGLLLKTQFGHLVTQITCDMCGYYGQELYKNLPQNCLTADGVVEFTG